MPDKQAPEPDNDSEAAQVPDHKNYLVYTDESGMHGARYYSFGSLWMPWERRGDFIGQLSELRDGRRISDELKWSKVTRYTEPFAREVVEWFFRRRWMMFHCVLIPRAAVDRTRHAGRDLAQQKHFAMLLKNKIARFGREGGKVYRIRIDTHSWAYEKADEVVHKVVNAQLKKELGVSVVHDIIARDSKSTPGIQVADLLLGCVTSAWQEEATSEPKHRLQRFLAEHLGWDDLRHDTHVDEWKFNIWYFYDPSSGAPRASKTRDVHLKYKMPVHRSVKPRGGRP
jgi:hypothetical protein